MEGYHESERRDRRLSVESLTETVLVTEKKVMSSKVLISFNLLSSISLSYTFCGDTPLVTNTN